MTIISVRQNVDPDQTVAFDLGLGSFVDSQWCGKLL